MINYKLMLKKEELEKLIYDSEDLNSIEIIDKSQEVDRLIVLYMKAKKKKELKAV